MIQMQAQDGMRMFHRLANEILRGALFQNNLETEDLTNISGSCKDAHESRACRMSKKVEIDKQHFQNAHELQDAFKNISQAKAHVRLWLNIQLRNLGEMYTAQYLMEQLMPFQNIKNKTQVLSLLMCHGLADVKNLALGRWVELHTLYITSCDALHSLEGLGVCTRLHTLDLSRCNALTNVASLGQCNKLHTLHLKLCKGLTDVAGLGQCNKLHTLHLKLCKGLTNVADLGNCSSLQSVDLTRCMNLSDVGGLAGCTSLHTLDLGDCASLTEVAALGNCKELQTLHLSHCS